MGSSTTKWTIEFPDERTEKRIKKLIDSSEIFSNKYEAFERDVTENPYHHPKHRRIKKLSGEKDYPVGSYRYRNDPIRVVYFPHGESRTVFPLEAATVTTVGYKRRS